MPFISYLCQQKATKHEVFHFIINNILSFAFRLHKKSKARSKARACKHRHYTNNGDADTEMLTIVYNRI